MTIPVNSGNQWAINIYFNQWNFSTQRWDFSQIYLLFFVVNIYNKYWNFLLLKMWFISTVLIHCYFQIHLFFVINCHGPGLTEGSYDASTVAVDET